LSRLSQPPGQGQKLAPKTGSSHMTMIFDLIIFLVIGLVAGAIASFYMGRQQELLPNLIIGIVGAFIGGFIARLLGLTAYNVIGEVVVATAGAIICLFVWQRIRGK
jgi:uncharacterized membrane protein YeaQ/YmgE (transglycosylase-associated protein family)